MGIVPAMEYQHHLIDLFSIRKIASMKTAEYLASLHAGWNKYQAPGDSERLIQFVAGQWKTSPALEDYARTYLPKKSVDLGPIELLPAERIEENSDYWDDGELFTHFGLLEIGGTVGCYYLFMLIDTGQVFILDAYDIPTEDHRDAPCYTEPDIDKFDIQEWINYCEKERAEGFNSPRMFESFEAFDEFLLAWHQESKKDK